MKIAALTASLLLIATSANAQEYQEFKKSNSTSVMSVQSASCFPRVAVLAQKLGVGPNDPGNSPTIPVAACNGKNYDLLQLIDALLLKMEKTANK